MPKERPKVRRVCCIPGCYNTSANVRNTKESIKFYKFPNETDLPSWKNEKRQQWIDAIGMKNEDGSPWLPKKNTFICNVHFVGGKSSENPHHPSYLPTLFPILHKTLIASRSNIPTVVPTLPKTLIASGSKRPVGILRRKDPKLSPFNPVKIASPSNAVTYIVMKEVSSSISQPKPELHKCSVATVSPSSRSMKCQANLPQDKEHSVFNYFECNRIVEHGICTAEVQVNIVGEIDRAVGCDISVDMMNERDVACEPGFYDKRESQIRGFEGLNSIRNNSELTDFSGITFDTFDLLVSLLPDIWGKELSLKNKLLIFLMKLKLDLTYSALASLFSVHQGTVWKIFLEILKSLPTLLEDYIYLPTRDKVKKNLPQVCKAYYPNSRVIIDCIEIRVEQPTTGEQKQSMYSNHKRAFTVKFLLVCTPSGFISLKSKCYNGGASDESIAFNCGILDFIEVGDLILANKEFPKIKKKVEEKNAQFFMPPMLKEPQLSTSEVREPQEVALIRKHIKRCMDRIKMFHILSFLPTEMLPYADSIIQICCSLVNLQLLKSERK